MERAHRSHVKRMQSSMGYNVHVFLNFIKIHQHNNVKVVLHPVSVATQVMPAYNVYKDIFYKI